MKTPARFLSLVTVLSAPVLQAATITFDTTDQYANNFTELVNASDTNWVSGGYLEKAAGDTATIAKFNDSGTAGIDTYGDMSVTMDFSTSGPFGANGNSLGFFVRANGAGNQGYGAVFRMTSTTTADFRVWDSTSNPTTGALADQLGTQTLTGLPAGTFSLNTFYTFRLDVVNSGGNVVFTGSVYTQAGALLGTFSTITDTTTPVTTAGEVFVRMGSNSASPNTAVNRYDNFSVNAIPEPASVSLLGLGALLAGIRRRR